MDFAITAIGKRGFRSMVTMRNKGLSSKFFLVHLLSQVWIETRCISDITTALWGITFITSYRAVTVLRTENDEYSLTMLGRGIMCHTFTI